MIIVGAKGLAKEVLEIYAAMGLLDNLCFFDNVSTDIPGTLFGRFPVLRTFDEVRAYFEKSGDTAFCLGLGNPVYRYKLSGQLQSVGGKLVSAISPQAVIGTFDITIGEGCTILPGAVITSGVHIGKGCLINPNATISHDTRIGDFVEISPGVCITGHAQIGRFSILGTGTVVLPKIILGENTVTGAGAVVTKNTAGNVLLAGVPAGEKKQLPSLTI